MPPGELALTDAPTTPRLAKSKTVQAERDKAQAVLMLGYRGADISDPDRYALELIDEASSDMGSRLFIRIREQMGLAYFVGAGQMQALVPGLFAFYLGTDPEKVEEVTAAFLDEVRELSANGLTQAELARAKKKLIGQQQIANQSNDTFAYMSALDEIYGLGFDRYKELEATVNAVTPADIKRVASKYFGGQPHVLAVVRPPVARPGTKGK
jgi:zinc protease